MEVKINREIRNYTESMFFGLSLRQFVFSLLAVVVAVGLYFLIRNGNGQLGVYPRRRSLCRARLYHLSRHDRRAVYLGVDSFRNA